MSVALAFRTLTRVAFGLWKTAIAAFALKTKTCSSFLDKASAKNPRSTTRQPFLSAPMPRPRVRQGRPQVGVLSIGINYFRQRGELKGCVNDSNNFIKMMRTRYGPNLAEVVQLVDTAPSTGRMYPSKTNIETACKYFARRCQQGRFTHLVFHFSGHGSQVRDLSGDEDDGLDEVLVPVDYARRGMITDDWLVQNVINSVGAVKVFALIDACHSGSMMDLPYTFDGAHWQSAKKVQSKPNANAVMISGCRDDQVSYDVWDATYGASGAMTTAFMRAFLKNPKAPAWAILSKMRDELKAKGYPQLPQLSSTAPFRVDQGVIPALGDL